jgi:hypothetical protein
MSKTSLKTTVEWNDVNWQKLEGVYSSYKSEFIEHRVVVMSKRLEDSKKP